MFNKTNTKLPSSAFEELNESQLIGILVARSYNEFIPVRNATADLDSYELMSILKSRKRKRNEKQTGSPSFKKRFVEKLSSLCPNESNEVDQVDHQLYPAEVFDLDENERSFEKMEHKKIGEQRSAFSLQMGSEWGVQAPNLPRVPSLSLRWKTDTKAPSVDLGNIYEKKLTRFKVEKWLAANKDKVNQRELKSLSSTSDLFLIYHVLYSDKIVIQPGSASGEKELAAGSTTASSTFYTTGPPEAVAIRPEDVGIKPIAFKVLKLRQKRGAKKSQRLALAPQQAHCNVEEMGSSSNDSDKSQQSEANSQDELELSCTTNPAYRPFAEVNKQLTCDHIAEQL